MFCNGACCFCSCPCNKSVVKKSLTTELKNDDKLPVVRENRTTENEDYKVVKKMGKLIGVKKGIK